MAAKKIMVSFSEGDKAFCRDKRLSPSKLLQERITQIRDEQTPALRDMILKANSKLENTTRKLNHFVGSYQKLIDEVQNTNKFSVDEWTAIIEKI